MPRSSLPLRPAISSALSSMFSLTGPPSTQIYTLSLHDALPISSAVLVGSAAACERLGLDPVARIAGRTRADRKSTRLNSSHVEISYAVFCLKKKRNTRVLFSLIPLIFSLLRRHSSFLRGLDIHD